MNIKDFPLLTQLSWNSLVNETVPSEFKNVFEILLTCGICEKEDTKVAYDIGASVGHFTSKMLHHFSNVDIIGFEPFIHHKPIHDFYGWNTHWIGLSNVNEKKTFYTMSEDNPYFVHTCGGSSGNSYYKENDEVTKVRYDKTVEIQCYKLDDYVKEHNLPLPFFIKIDVQGAEMDIILGGINTFSHANFILCEVQFIEYNKGAPSYEEIVRIMNNLNFTQMIVIKSDKVQADILFIKEHVYQKLKEINVVK